ncbi:UDP-N-acetylenolpyruvoylglucosamine reductase [Bordetella sputigena]|uniref:UDP-N-acetylmuramate dehydrogenase n=1 Tax=Bordetella sputigena TaxID=1416810 RepID=UPI0039EE6718
MSNPSVQAPHTDALTPIAADLTALNTFGLVSTAQAYVRIVSPAQLPALSALARRHGRVFVLGGGSNVVLPSSIEGLVAHMAIPGIRLVEARDDAWIVEAGGGENWHGFVESCLRKGWDGLENLALIPGTVGASPVQNIGAYGVELDQRFLSLTAWDITRGEMVEMSARDCRFAYRDSRFKHDEPGRWAIVSVRFALPRPWRPVLDYPDLRRHPALAGGLPAGASSDSAAATATPSGRDSAPVAARAIFDAVCGIRRQKLPDPAVVGNAGSFFKNPIVTAGQHAALRDRFPDLVSYPQADGRYKLAAGWLIDQCGWKGRSLGPVGVHDRQALVLINRGGARAADITALADAIRADVRARYGVDLEPEPVRL